MILTMEGQFSYISAVTILSVAFRLTVCQVRFYIPVLFLVLLCFLPSFYSSRGFLFYRFAFLFFLLFEMKNSALVDFVMDSAPYSVRIYKVGFVLVPVVSGWCSIAMMAISYPTFRCKRIDCLGLEIGPCGGHTGVVTARFVCLLSERVGILLSCDAS